jgi:MFS family permease
MVVFLGGLLASLGAALQGGAVSIAMLIAGRFIAGIAIGQMSATIPVYCVRQHYPLSSKGFV